MAQPIPYVRRYDFLSFQTLNPVKPLPAQEHENEYNAIAQSIGQLCTNLGLIQRDDGELANGSVGWDQLDDAVVVGIQQPHEWIPNHLYTEAELVYGPVPHSSKIFRCTTEHVSGPVFQPDLDAGLWILQIDFQHGTDAADEAAAEAIAALDEFQDIYLGPHPVDPLTDNDGDPLQVGAFYWNTTTLETRTWTGTLWQWTGQSATAGVYSFNTRVGVVELTAQDVIDTGVLGDYATNIGAVLQTSATGAAIMPAGDTSERPLDALAGYLRFNIITQKFEGHNGVDWGSIGGGAYIGLTPPTNPQPGDFWWSSDLLTLFVYYDDGNSKQWVSTTPSFNGGLYMPKSGGAFNGPVVFQSTATFNAAANFAGLTANGANIGVLVADTANITTANVTDLKVGNSALMPSLTVGSVLAKGTVIDPTSVQIGQGLTGNRYAYLDLVSDDTYTDFGLRISRDAGGANGVSAISHRGSGPLQLISEYAGGGIHLISGGAERLWLTDYLYVSTKSHFTNPYQNSGAAQGDGASQMTVYNNGGGGDGDVAAIALHCGSYAAKVYLRQDGVMGFGGWSKAAHAAYIDGSNNWIVQGNIASVSDARLKDDVEQIENAYGLLAGIHGYRFRWNDRSSLYVSKAGKADYGVLAHQVKATLPEIIQPTIEDEKTGEVYDTVCYEKLIPLMLEVIHEQQARIKALELKIR